MGRLRPKGVPFAGFRYTISNRWLESTGEHMGLP